MLKMLYTSGHRVIHALESAQWIKLASSSADLTIYGGDFNTEPTSVPYKLVRRITPMIDAWAEVHGDNRAGSGKKINLQYWQVKNFIFRSHLDRRRDM